MGPKVWSNIRMSSVLVSVIRFILILELFFSWNHSRKLVLAFALVSLFATFIPNILRQWGVKTGATLQIILLFIIYGSLFIGEIRGVFGDSWWWSVFLRAIGAMVLAFIGFTIASVLKKEEVLQVNGFMFIAISFSLAFTLGALAETAEFTLDSLFGFGLQKLGTANSAVDLAISAVVSLLVSIIGYGVIKHSSETPGFRFIADFLRGNPNIFREKNTNSNSAEHIKELIKKGEDHKLEFKSTMRTNTHTGEIDKNIELSAMKTIAAYLNTKGGTLLLGVNNDGEIHGLEKDAFDNIDKLKLHLNNLLKNHLGSQFNSFIDYSTHNIDGKTVLKVDCVPSTKRVFLRNGNDEEFYIRNGPASQRLHGNALIDYINNRFRE